MCYLKNGVTINSINFLLTHPKKLKQNRNFEITSFGHYCTICGD